MEPDDALKDIKTIRKLMTQAARPIFFSPWQWVEWGIIVLVGCMFTYWLGDYFTQTNLAFFWIFLIVLGGFLEAAIWYKESIAHGVEPINTFSIQLLLVASLLFFVAIIFSIVFIQIEHLQYIPGAWMLCTGVALWIIAIFSARKDLVPLGIIQILGSLLAVSFFIDYSLLVTAICLGLGFIAWGLILRIKGMETL